MLLSVHRPQDIEVRINDGASQPILVWIAPSILLRRNVVKVTWMRNNHCGTQPMDKSVFFFPYNSALIPKGRRLGWPEPDQNQ